MPTKILHVIASTHPKYGGPVEVVKQISAVLAARNISVEVACLDAPNDPWVNEFPVSVHALGPASLPYWYCQQFLPWLEMHISEYDCVFLHGVWLYSGYGAWLALKKSKIPYFIYTHGALDPWFRRAYPWKHLKKSLYWIWREYRILRGATAVLFTCEEERVLAKQAFQPNQYNAAVVSLGTSAPQGDPMALRETFLTRFPELRAKRLLLFLGRIHAKKGCDLLLEALSHVAPGHDNLHLIMAGPDETGWEAELKQQADRLEMTNHITWTGMLAGDRKWGAYYASEAFVLPSHSENFGITVAEALACGLPVLISNRVNIWREILSDHAGLVANDDLAGTISLLQQWLRMDPRQQEKMRQNARKCFSQRFEINKATDLLLQALRENGISVSPSLPAETMEPDLIS